VPLFSFISFHAAAIQRGDCAAVGGRQVPQPPAPKGPRGWPHKLAADNGDDARDPRHNRKAPIRSYLLDPGWDEGLV
jgi:hypothetical protein